MISIIKTTGIDNNYLLRTKRWRIRRMKDKLRKKRLTKRNEYP